MAKITYKGGFTGEPVTKEGTVEREYTDGWRSACGSWSKAKYSDELVPAVFVVVKWKKTGRLQTFPKEGILSVEE
jgi:hypothetical protein